MNNLIAGPAYPHKEQRDPLRDGVSLVEYIQHTGSDKMIVHAARVSYASDTGNEEFDAKDRKLLKYLIENNHGTPLEHNLITFKVRAPLYVIQEMLRHRVGMCLAGDTQITFVDINGHTNKKLKKSIKELYDTWHLGEKHPCNHSGYRDGKSRIKNMRLRVLNEQTGKFETSHIENIFSSGLKDIYEFTTKNGKIIKCSKDHKFFTPKGWFPIGELLGLSLNGLTASIAKKEFVYTNGIMAYKDYEYIKQLRDAKLSVKEIADKCNVSYHTIRKWLKIHNLKFTPKERSAIGGTWNKGRVGYKLNLTTDSRGRRSAAQKERMKNRIKNPDAKAERQRIGSWTTRIAKFVHEKNGFKCKSCDKIGGKLHAHHIVPVAQDLGKAYDANNLTSLCVECHAKIHNKDLETYHTPSHLRAIAEQVVSVKYIGKEETFDISVAAPWHNFVANGFVVHNSFNQESHRYIEPSAKSDVICKFYVPQKFRKQDQKNKQSSSGEFTEQEDFLIGIKYRKQCEKAFEAYEELIEMGVARELARGVLPHSTYSSLYFTCNIRSLVHFLELRLDERAQWEIRRFAQAMASIAQELFPETFNILKELGKLEVQND